MNEATEVYRRLLFRPYGAGSPMKHPRLLVLSLLLPALCLSRPRRASAETVRVPATADVWLSDANDHERHSSSGKSDRFKLKSIQEMAAIRFDGSRVLGMHVHKATLFLNRAGDDQLRYIRVSTVNGDWEEGDATIPYSPGDGATYLLADARSNRPWSWPGSCFADVVMTSGNSLATWAECKKLPDGWVSVEITPELVYAMAVGDTDGLAVMDGGTLALHNNMIHSVQSGRFAPYILTEVDPRPAGDRPGEAPAKPSLRAEPAPQAAHLHSGAVRISVGPVANAFCWRVMVDHGRVPRWRVPHPSASAPTVFDLDDLPADRTVELEVTAVSGTGKESPPAKASVRSSPALPAPPSLGEFRRPAGSAEPEAHDNRLRVWALADSVKVSPENPEPMAGEMDGDPRAANAVWDGKAVHLFGARGEYVAFQLCVENAGDTPLAGIKVSPGLLHGPGGSVIGRDDVELFKNWYAKNHAKAWQPAYLIPLEPGTAFQIPDPQRNLPHQQNQTVSVDVYIPKDARAGEYAGAVKIEADGVKPFEIPVKLEVFNFALPDRLSFWPELNAYQVPKDALDYCRLAHQHRCVLNCWRWEPQVHGSGKDVRVDWGEYDRTAGQLISGDAFKNNRRAGVPVECMYLPFDDSWPTNLTPKTYHYAGHWPGRGESPDTIVQHYLTAPYIGDALSEDYKDAFRSVERQFIDHFAQKGWKTTEMQCFFGGKNTHRIDYGSNLWWTTDEPMHWDDWLAQQFFDRLWTETRGIADPHVWAARADISRPQWMGRTLDGVTNTVYFGAGAFSSPANYRRCRTIAAEAPLKLMTYGSCNPETQSNLRCVTWVLNVWLNGGNGALPWQTLGPEEALDSNDDAAGGGNALLVPAKRLGHTVVADLRVNSLRDAEQLAEYLALVAERRYLTREQVAAMVAGSFQYQAGIRSGAGADNADALEFTAPKDWQIAELRRHLAELIR